MSVPALILRRLYVKKSMKNTETGFQFSLKNVLADASLSKPLEIIIDDKPVPIDKITLESDSKVILNKDISDANPVDFALNTQVTVRVEGVKLEPGEHKIVISAVSREYGPIKFDIKDVVS
uniref:Hydroxymethylglutaryl-CoA reductase-like domain-containing protein n=1 Tax=Thermosphaera aggregans TaxID=54254 RepID=A0A7C2FCF5_9CREN